MMIQNVNSFVRDVVDQVKQGAGDNQVSPISFQIEVHDQDNKPHQISFDIAAGEYYTEEE